MECEVRGLLLRTGEFYGLRAINRYPFNDLQLAPESDRPYKQLSEDTNLCTIHFQSATQASLETQLPCATIMRLPMVRTGSLKEVLSDSKVAHASSPNYPEVSSFKPIQLYPELPLPDAAGKIPEIRDYTEEEKEAVRKDVSKWIINKDGCRYMTPKPGVEIKIDIKDDEGLSHALLAKMLSELPDGVWMQENPKVLPGVPPEDVAVRVTLLTDKPIHRKMRRMSPEETATAKEYLTKEIELGLFEPANSPWASNITWAPKADGTLRFCVDYRTINDITLKDCYPLPRMENVVANIKGKKFISLIDMAKGFNNLVIHPDDRDQLAFNTPLGQLRPVRLPFGLMNGPPIFQRQVDLSLLTLLMIFSAYLDDISGGYFCQSKNPRHALMYYLVQSVQKRVQVERDQSSTTRRLPPLGGSDCEWRRSTA